jgi:flagellin-like hook-associated protein FlgL
LPLSINTNLSSLATQRALSQSQDLRTAAVQRLSSGLRINAARDDAAGLAISERLTAQVRGLAQSARNAQDAIGMSQTAEAALASISDNLQRVRELAVRAANGTNSAAERNSLDAEVQQRVAEIDRIAASTSFGEIKLLDGTAGMLAMQIGPNVGQTVGVDLSASLRSNAFGAMASVRSADLTARLAAPGGLVLGAGDLTVQVGSGGAVSVTGTFRTIEALASAVNAAMGGKGTASVTQVAAALANQATQQSGGHWDRSSGEVRNDYAFAALKADGSVVTWGSSTTGGNSSAVAAQLASGVQAIYSTSQAVAALKANGSVVTWGSSSFGGNSSAVAAQLTGGVQAIYSSSRAFAALKADGSVVTWGDSNYGGNSSAVAAQLASGVQAIYSNPNAFAALKADGSVVTWGGSLQGGNSSAVAAQLTGGVQALYSTNQAFAALKADGSIVTWGDSSYGGNSSTVAAQLTGGVRAIDSSSRAFAALKADGSVVNWGNSSYGGDSSAVAAQLTGGVQAIYSAGSAFAALKADGSVVTWGNSTFGGNSSAVAAQLTGGVQAIYSNQNAFAALKADGSVVTWGDSSYGGNSSAVAAQLTGGVQAIYSNQWAFAALKADGSVVTWGNSSYGGNSSAVAAQLSSGVQSLASPLNEEQATTGSTVAGGARLILNATEAITFGGTQRSILGFAAFTAPSGNVAGMRTTTAAEATETLLRADVALQTIATERARIGVTLNRFDLLIDDLATAGNNLTASRSRITDADVAAEIANLTRAQIVQQAGQAMLAQANTNARLILALLPT